MGCDIHPVVQRRVDGVWQTVRIPNAEMYAALRRRDYNLFSALADVRNYEPENPKHVKPIQANRGLPADFMPPNREEYGLPRELYDDEVDTYFDMGDHSFGWVTLAELIAYNFDGAYAWTLTHNGKIPFIDVVMPWLKTLGAPDDVRLVFGFDS